MTTMNISLPAPLREFVETQLSEGGYASASEYMRELIRDAKQRKLLEQRLGKALQSEDLGEMTPEVFEALRARLK